LQAGRLDAFGFAVLVILYMLVKCVQLVQITLIELLENTLKMLIAFLVGHVQRSGTRKDHENVLKDFAEREAARPPDIILAPKLAQDILQPKGQENAQVVSETKSVEFDQESAMLRGETVRGDAIKGSKKCETASNDIGEDCIKSASAAPLNSFTNRGDGEIVKARSAPVDSPQNPFVIAIELANEQAKAPRKCERAREGGTKPMEGADEGTSTSRTQPAGETTEGGGAPTHLPPAENARGTQSEAPGNGRGERAAENVVGRGGWVAKRPGAPGGSHYKVRLQRMRLQGKEPINIWPKFNARVCNKF
jgi:hypothetical protein